MSLFSEKYFLLSFLFLAFQLLPAEAQRTILYQDEFIGEDGKGKVGTLPVDTTGVLWGIDVSGGAFGNNSFFSVGRLDSEVFEAQRVNGPVQWTSRIFHVTGEDSLEFSFDALADGTFDISDVFRVEIVIDGAAELLFEGTVSGGTMNFGGMDLTNSLQTFTSSIVDTGNQAYIQITCDVDNPNELLGFDNLEVTGVPTLPTVGWIDPLSSTTETNSSQTITIPVFLVNYENPVDVSVSVAGSSSAESSDYVLNTTSLNFTQNDTLDVSLTINSDSGFDNELLDLKLTETTTTGIIINPVEHVHEIIDDELEPLPTAFINELHYYEQGGDNNNFVEIALIEEYTGSLEHLSVTLYDGNGGTAYDSLTLDNFVSYPAAAGFFYYTWNPPGGIKNGVDGLALVFQGRVIEFLSYEGVFQATDGPANGLQSTDIDVVEPNSTSTGNSLQRKGSCVGTACPSGLDWVPPSPDSQGGPNEGALLPVQWLDFSVTKPTDKSGVHLTWSVAGEESHDFYEVLHSTDGVRWNSLQVVSYANRIDSVAVSEVQKTYKYIHSYPALGLNLYRIRQVDRDGAEDFSEIKQTVVGGDITGLKVSPIPARDRLYFNWPSPDPTTRVEISLINMESQSSLLYRGEAPGMIQLPYCPAGIYQLLVRDLSGAVLHTQRVVIQ